MIVGCSDISRWMLVSVDSIVSMDREEEEDDDEKEELCGRGCCYNVMVGGGGVSKKIVEVDDVVRVFLRY